MTIEDGAAQTINEASVANALVNGTKDPAANPTTWTVTDANNKKMIVTKATGATKVDKVPTEDGHELSVNALKWKGTVEGTEADAKTFYAVEYDNGTKKSYKIVKVVK